MDNFDKVFNKIGMGVDIVDISRFREYTPTDLFIKKVFSKKEIEYCFKGKASFQHLAARFAAKEATIKALSMIGETVNIGDIHIENLEDGRPIIILLNHKDIAVKVSLSHSMGNAVAFVIVAKKGDNNG